MCSTYSPSSIIHPPAARFTFSAKEKDAESGLSYFGARYYSSDLSLWLSVDPMADKYPSMSPYVYCADNPVKLVDPNGEEWFVNEDGFIKKGSNIDDHNVYFVKGRGEQDFGDSQKDSDGNIITVNIGKDIHQSTMQESGFYKDIDGKTKPYNSESFDLSDIKSAQKFFRYASKYTDNEWSFWGDDKGFHLSTSHIAHTDIYGGREVLKSGKNGTISFFFHSQPRSETLGMFVNDRDRNTQRACLAGNPNAVIGVMHRGVLYDFKANKMNWDGSKK